MTEFDGHDRESMGDDLQATRERMRAVIRREIEAFHPTDEARQPLELIVESSLRYSEKDGVLTAIAMGESGNPRAAGAENAETAVRAVLEDIRRTRPALFKTTMDEPSENQIAPAGDGVDGSDRDWLDVGSPPPISGMRQEMRSFPLSVNWHSIDAWFHRQAPRWKGAATRQGATLGALGGRVPGLLRQARETMRASADPARKDRFWHKRPLVLGGLAALLALGTFTMLRVGGNSGGLAETGAVTASTGLEAGSLRGVPEVIDTSTLSLDGRVLRLFGVEWAPGGGKPDDLNRYLSGREVTCEEVASTNTYRCQVDGKDLSTVVLYNGGGRATAQATEEMKAAAEHARQTRIGVWSR
jgi:hypothetical protein